MDDVGVIVAAEHDGYLVTIAEGWTLNTYLFDVETGRVELVSEVDAGLAS